MIKLMVGDIFNNLSQCQDTLLKADEMKGHSANRNNFSWLGEGTVAFVFHSGGGENMWRNETSLAVGNLMNPFLWD